MTREAKIGMLTGLAVIILIGVLLSSYLGDGKGAMLANSRMSSLPVGEEYRQQAMHPVGVPAMAASGNRVRHADGTEVYLPIDTSQVPAPMMAAADVLPTGPVVGPAVSAVPAGPTHAARDAGGGPPTFELVDPSTLYEAKLRESSRPDVPADPTVVTYTIMPGDNLAKIAKKFYNSSKNSDVARIVKANPAVLKDASTTLMVGRTLTIPGIAPVAAPMPSVNIVRSDTVVVYRPGDLPVAGPDQPRKIEPPSMGASTPPNASQGAKTYVVQPGDTLEKIARKLAPAKSSEMVKKLISLNGIRNPDALPAGARLKIPG